MDDEIETNRYFLCDSYLQDLLCRMSIKMFQEKFQEKQKNQKLNLKQTTLKDVDV